MAILKSGTSADTSAARLAEHRVRQWTLNLETQCRRFEKRSKSELSVDIHPYVAISRETGSGGGVVARRVGDLLGWEVLHRELLDQMADKFNLRRDLLGMIDEQTSNWVIELFGKWLDPRLVTRSQYIVHLGQIVLLAAQNAHTIFVGRGAQFFLPAEKGLSVHLVAPLSMRIRHVCDIKGCTEAEARRFIRDTDRGRQDLIKSSFNRMAGDPHLYDLVINRAHTSEEEAAELIAQQCRSRFPGI